MTNKVALWLGLILVIAIAADWLLADGGGLLFIARKFAALVVWLAFWR